MKIFNTKKGFTLIELIVVISIIAVLAVLGMSSYQSIQQDSRNTRRKADLKELQKSLEAYKSRNGVYPSTCSPPAETCALTAANWRSICGVAWATGVACEEIYIPGLAPEFIAALPRDPRQNRINSSSATEACKTTADRNTYAYKSDGTDYKLLVLCTPEGTMSEDDPFFDPERETEAWQISSSSVSRGWQ